MIDVIQSMIIGGVQGISEFLPISSSGHLVLIPYVFTWDYQGLSFDIALHFGTMIAIIAYFWRDWLSIISAAFKRENAESSYPKNLLWQIIIASIPAALIGFFLENYVETYLHSPVLISFDLIVFGIILWLVDKYFKSDKKIKNISFGQSFLVGCAQAIALIPGVSRSGITMTAGRSMGLTKKDAARFSFLLATPAMFGAFLLSFEDISSKDLNSVFLFGVLSSTIFGFFAIKYLLKYLEKGNFSVFVWYRVIIALIVMFVYFSK